MFHVKRSARLLARDARVPGIRFCTGKSAELARMITTMFHVKRLETVIRRATRALTVPPLPKDADAHFLIFWEGEGFRPPAFAADAVRSAPFAIAASRQRGEDGAVKTTKSSVPLALPYIGGYSFSRVAGHLF